MARMMSVDLSMTMTAAVPRPDRSLTSESKSMTRSLQSAAGRQRTEAPPGMTARRLSPPPRTAPARPRDMAGDAEELGADIVRPADAGKPALPAPQDRRRDRDRFDVVDRRRAAVDANRRRERRLPPREAPLAPQAFHE